jgi:gliding motility-associated-like protein
MKNNKQFFIFLLLCLSFYLRAQFPNPSLFNTATNATGTGTLPVGTNDMNWTASINSISGPYIPAISCGNQVPGSWVTSPYPNTNWIVYPHTCPWGTQADHSCLGQVDEYYKLEFNLPALGCNGLAVTTPSAYCLTLDYYADNWLDGIYVNGIVSYTNPTANPYGSWGFNSSGGKTVSLCNNWVPGTNTVIALVKSGSGWTGLLAQANQNVNINGTSLSASTTQTNVSCFGGSDGSGRVYPTGGVGAYTFTWMPAGGNNSVANNLSAGTYTVVTGSGSCTFVNTVTITEPAPITLSVSSNTIICNGGSVTFTAGGATTYSWSTGALASSITTSASGVYSVTGTSAGCSMTKTVSLLNTPGPIISISGNTLVCPGQNISLSASGANTYVWHPGNVTGPVLFTAPVSNTTYSVNGSDAFGCVGSAIINVSVTNAALGIQTSSPSICEGESSQLIASGATTYTWIPGNQNGATIIVSPSATQDYTVYSSVNNCPFTATQSISVTPVPTLAVSSSPDTVCAGSQVILTASGASTYQWMPGNGNGSSFTATPIANQIYTVTGFNGSCSDQEFESVTVVQSADINVVVDPLQICAGQTAVLTASGAYTFLWVPGNFTGSSYTVQPSQNTSYTVTGSIGNCSGTSVANVGVSSAIADFVHTGTNGVMFDVVDFTNLSVHNEKNFWYFGNNQTSTELHPSLRYDEPGTYVACLMVTNDKGCSDTLCKVINIGCLDDMVFVPNSFTPNEDGLNDEFRAIAPGQCIDKFRLSIFDRWGEKLFASDNLENGWDGSFRGKPVENNIYVYVVEYTLNGKKASSKTGHVAVMR